MGMILARMRVCFIRSATTAPSCCCIKSSERQLKKCKQLRRWISDLWVWIMPFLSELVHSKNIWERKKLHFIHNYPYLGTEVSPRGPRVRGRDTPGTGHQSSCLSPLFKGHGCSALMVYWRSGMAERARCLQLCAFLQRGFAALG